jgi:ribonucleoside-triphosphate reductase (thioredoxin)
LLNPNNINTPWGEIGYPVYKRTYARRLDSNNPNSPTEEFEQTVDRVVKASNSQLGVGFTHAEQERFRDILLGLKGSVAGRFWWQLGTTTVDKLGLLSLQNCAFVIVNEPVRPFTWAMDALMLGSGVGFNIQRHNVYELPRVKEEIVITRQDTKDADFIVPDSREGWVGLLAKVLKAHFYGGKGFTYSTTLIRGKGAPIKGFGGTASGPEELCWGIGEISKILNKRAGKKVRSIDCLDIMNIIGAIVVAGNVRRSAQIAIGDPHDIDFLLAKRWDLNSIPRWRSNSNNSVATSDMSELHPLFWDTYKQGEPYGLINLKVSRAYGRLGDTNYPDPRVEGFNPCAEQSLENHETCCLADVFLPNITSMEELFEVCTYLYRVNKHSLALPCHLPETEAIVHANMRMGIGITGALQATQEQRDWLPHVYDMLRDYDETYSREHGFPISIKLTTVKPSGTLSLLAGVTPGAHANPAGPWYWRRVRMASDSPILSLCKSNGYPVEPMKNLDGTEDHNTMVVTFPCKVPEHTPIADEFTAVEQLDFVKWMQTNWSDNAVSVTVTYKMEELDTIKEWLNKNYNSSVKTVSFLLYSGHGFAQAPYESCTKEEYEELAARVIPITGISSLDESAMETMDDCSSGACPIK